MLGAGSFLVPDRHWAGPSLGLQPVPEPAPVLELALEPIGLLLVDEREDRVRPERCPLLEAVVAGDLGQQLGKPRLVDLPAANADLVHELGLRLRARTTDATHGDTLLHGDVRPASPAERCLSLHLVDDSGTPRAAARAES
jgi:hypothetical protein